MLSTSTWREIAEKKKRHEKIATRGGEDVRRQSETSRHWNANWGYRSSVVDALNADIRIEAWDR